MGNPGDIDTACVTLLTPSGKQAVILNSRRTAYGFDQRIEAFGSTGLVMSGNAQGTGFKRFSSTSFGAPDRFRAFFMERYGDSYRLEIEAFVHGLAQGQSASVNAIDGLPAVYLAEAAARRSG